MKENFERGVYIENLSEHSISSAYEGLKLFIMGLQRKKIFQTIKNIRSSRSHTIFQIKQYSKVKDRLISKFSLVDLAGSERLSEQEKNSERVEEAKYINKSLSALGNVIYQLKNDSNKKNFRKSKHQNFHIPYRDSKLTHILKDSLGGNSLTHVIITLSPAYEFLQETLSSMKFAHNAKSVKQQLKENVSYFVFISV